MLKTQTPNAFAKARPKPSKATAKAARQASGGGVSSRLAARQPRLIRLGCLSLVLLQLEWGAGRMAAQEEAAGPFPSWRNLKTDYGAVGDGRADDTARCQRALNELAAHQHFCVLYVPPGHYRLTQSLQLSRHQALDARGISLIGADPAACVLQWAGPTNVPMVQWSAWYSKISRLTLDGQGRAAVGLAYGPQFSTYNETSDLILRDCATGLLLGSGKSAGQAENEVLRCQFLRCREAGLHTDNFNSLDIWVWYCAFTDCGHALLNGAGNFHAWENVFTRSRVADVGAWNLQVFSFVNNTSLDSRCFINFDTGNAWGSPMTIGGNQIIHPTGELPVRLGNGGPFLLVDNIFKMPAGSTNRAVKMSWADQTLVGNTYSTPNPVMNAGRFRRLAESIVAPDRLTIATPALPAPPPRLNRHVIEVRPRFDWPDDYRSYHWAIQAAIDAADHSRGQHPVVHLPMGNYKIKHTLVIPAGSDVQLVGDGAMDTGTCLRWTGPPGGVILKLKGPSQATLRDLCLEARSGHALQVENADQAGGKIFADQLDVRCGGPATNPVSAALQINGLVHTDVLLRALQGSGNMGEWVAVSGAGELPPAMAPGQTSIFTGACGGAVGQYDVRNGGRLTVRSVYHEKTSANPRFLWLQGAGTLSLDACQISYQTSPAVPFGEFHDFKGRLTVAASTFNNAGATNTCWFAITGTGAATHALVLNDLFWVHEPGVATASVWRNQAVPPALGGLLGCNFNTPDLKLAPRGFGELAEMWNPAKGPARVSTSPASLSDAADADLLAYLEPLRTARVWLPAAGRKEITNLQLHRIMATGDLGPVVEFRAGSADLPVPDRSY